MPLSRALYAITGQPYLHHIKSLNLILKSLIIYHGGLAMPGAFAHITAVNFAISNSNLKSLNMPKKAKLALSRNQKFVELGCVSPDFPYLKLGSPDQNEWADKMHYEKVGVLIRKAILLVKNLSGEDQEKAFAWLCGFVAHVISDITIHPVVEMRVGPYHENSQEHRICEMNQDAYIWPKLNLGEIGYAERVKNNIGSCNDPTNPSNLDRIITKLWETCLKDVFPEKADSTHPDINGWYKGFQFIVDNIEEGYRLFPLARHVAAKQGLVYPSLEEIDESYIKALKTPCGIEDYDSIFERAVENVKQYLCYLSNAVFDDGSVDMFLNWNLDTGRCEKEMLTAWSNS
nr:zinc dependent phospholipase C family protein [Vibrio genomosp. F10]